MQTQKFVKMYLMKYYNFHITILADSIRKEFLFDRYAAIFFPYIISLILMWIL